MSIKLPRCWICEELMPIDVLGGTRIFDSKTNEYKLDYYVQFRCKNEKCNAVNDFFYEDEKNRSFNAATSVHVEYQDMLDLAGPIFKDVAGKFKSINATLFDMIEKLNDNSDFFTYINKKLMEQQDGKE